MDNTRRLQYLEAMGIDVWVPIDEPYRNAVSLMDEPFFAEFAPVDGKVLNTYSANMIVQQPAPESAMDWEALQQTVAQCRKCALCETRTQTVFGSGNRHASWMLIGEAPGQQEDLQGEPFVGKAGQLLTEMLRAIGLPREQVYIANVLKCRPPNNRDPQPSEMQACNAYLQRQIALVQPKMLLAAGRIAAQHLLQTDASMAKLRGKVHYVGDIPLLVIYHPAYLLRSLLEKRKAWDDLQMALRIFREPDREG